MRARPKSSISRSAAAIATLAIALPAILLSTSSSAAGPTFGSPIKAGNRGFEQGINMLPDGTIFVDEPAGFGAHSNAWRLDPGATSYTKLVFPTPWGRLPGGGDSDIALTSDGRVYFLDLWVGSNSIAVSEDRGETWSIGTPFTTLPLTDRQWIAVGERDESTGKDTVYVVYQQFSPPNWVMFSRSRDGGLTWDYHRPAPFLTGGVSGSTGKLVADGDFVAFSYDQNRVMHVATSPDAGETWESKPVSILPNADRTITGTALSGQHLSTAWLTNPSGTQQLQFARSTDRGGIWDPAVTIADVEGTAVFSWVTSRYDPDTQETKVAAAWYETPVDALQPDDVGSAAIWTVKYVESLDGGLTWSDPVAVTDGVRRGIICTRGLDCSTGREVGDFITLTIGPDMMSRIAYHDGIADGSCCGGMVVTQTS